MWRLAAWVIGTWWLAHLLMILGHVLHVLVYAVAIEPGLDHADYQAYAQASGPWFSIIVGGPVFYRLGRMLRKRTTPRGRSAGLLVWGLYSATDFAVLLAFSVTLTTLLVVQWLTSQGIKLAAVLLATRRAEQTA